jgi:hypothetical protein
MSSTALAAVFGGILVTARIAQLLVRTPQQQRASAARRAAKNRLTKAIAELRDGEAVSLSGTVVAGSALLEAPLSGKSCVYWAATARMFRLERRKAVLLGETHAAKLVSFRLETADGVVHVEGEAAETELPSISVIPRKIDRDRAFLTAQGHEWQLASTAGFNEVTVAPGDKISVHGVVVIERAAAVGEAGYRDEAARIRLVDHPAHRLTLGKPR